MAKPKQNISVVSSTPTTTVNSFLVMSISSRHPHNCYPKVNMVKLFAGFIQRSITFTINSTMQWQSLGTVFFIIMSHKIYCLRGNNDVQSFLLLQIKNDEPTGEPTMMGGQPCRLNWLSGPRIHECNVECIFKLYGRLSTLGGQVFWMWTLLRYQCDASARVHSPSLGHSTSGCSWKTNLHNLCTTCTIVILDSLQPADWTCIRVFSLLVNTSLW